MRCALLLCVLLGGCAADCTVASWEERGYVHGYGGSTPQDMTLSWLCGRQGIQVGVADYMKGWNAGHEEWLRLSTMKCD